MSEEKEKMPTLTLTDIRIYGGEEDHFRIQAMKNTTDYKIDDCLSTNEVDGLIAQGWTVNIKA